MDGAAASAAMLALRPTPAVGFPVDGLASVAVPARRFRLVLPAAARPAHVADLAGQVARIGASRGLGAVATALAVRSGLGNGPWDTLTLAAHRTCGVGVGALSTALSAAFTAVAWRLGARPNPLLLAANAAAGGLAVDWLLPHVQRAAGPVAAGAYLAGAVAASAAGATLVLGAPHARTAYDHLLLRVVARQGWALGRARWTLDLPALGAGWALGGAVGPGTVACALLVGPLAQRAARRLGWAPPAGPAAAAHS